MLRVWASAVGFLLTLLFIYLLVGFFGETSLKFAAVLVGAGFATAYLPGGIALSRAIYLFVGVLIGSLGFLAGAMLFPDTDRGIFFGGCVPVIVSTIVAMWSRKQEVFVTLMIGAGAVTAVYTTSFFTDPQGINYQLPLAIGGTIAPLGIGYLVAALIKTFLPNKPKESADNPVTPSTAPGEPTDNANETNQADAADQTETSDNDELIKLS